MNESAPEVREDGNDRMNALTSLLAAVLVAGVCASLLASGLTVLPGFAAAAASDTTESPASARSPTVAATPGAALLAPGGLDAAPAPILGSAEEPGSAGSLSSAAGAGEPDGTGFLRELLEAGEEEPEFLHPDDAFRMEVSSADPARAVVRWRIEPGYYLYAKRTEVHLPAGAPPGTSIAGFDLPPGEMVEDPYFGNVEIYRLEAAGTVRLAHAGSPPPSVALDVVYQGCADAGLCYPPIRKALAVRLGGASPGGPAGAPGAAVAFPVPPDEASLSETDRIAWQLATDGFGGVLAAFLGFGLLLAFTPCIFPMIPILSSILVAGERPGRGRRDSRARGLALSFAYVSGSAVAWAAIGGIAGLLGANVQIALQSPWALGTVSVVFVLLALSMFGLYTIELPAAWITRATGWTNRAGRGGGYAGAAAMGVVSALIVGPCVAAPMAGAVLYIGQAGDALRGSLALFAMGLGMGAPLLVLGASSQRLLPRAGPWMDTVQRAAGVVLLGVAAYLLERILPPAAAMVAWALVAVSAGLILFRAARRRPARAPPAARFAAGAGTFAAAAYAAVLLVGASTGAHDPLDPLRGLGISMGGHDAGPGELEFVSIKGLDGPDGLDAALARAQSSGRFVMLDFYADWCVACKEMEELTFRDPRVLAALENVRLLRADVTANDTADQALMKRVGVLGPPAILFFGPDRAERRRYRTVGFKDAAVFTKRVAGATRAA